MARDLKNTWFPSNNVSDRAPDAAELTVVHFTSFKGLPRSGYYHVMWMKTGKAQDSESLPYPASWQSKPACFIKSYYRCIRAKNERNERLVSITPVSAACSLSRQKERRVRSYIG